MGVVEQLKSFGLEDVANGVWPGDEMGVVFTFLMVLKEMENKMVSPKITPKTKLIKIKPLSKQLPNQHTLYKLARHQKIIL